MKKIIRITFAVLIFLVLSFYLKHVFELKDSPSVRGQFYKKGVDYDVAFLGSSIMQYAISPLQLERDYGISSYNLANPVNTMPINYWTLVNALDYNKDLKLVVLDCSNMSSGQKVEKSEFIHTYADSIPLSINKIKMINDLFDDSSTNKLEFLWNFYRYHNRYIELTQNDFEVYDLINRGGLADFTVIRDIDAFNQKLEETHRYEPVIDEDVIGVKYLEMIIEKCKEKNIEVLLTYLPSNKNIKKYKIESIKAISIAKRHNVNYLDIMNTDIYDEETDYLDDEFGVHLNYFGARKITDCLGNYIRANYSIPFSKSESFDEEYQDLFSSEQYMLDSSSQLEHQIVVAFDKKYNMVIGYNSNDVFYDSFYKNFFEYMGIDYARINYNNLIILENGGETIYYCNFENELYCDDNPDLKYKYVEVNDKFKDNHSEIGVMITLDNEPYMKYTEFNKTYFGNDKIIYKSS